MKNIYSLIAGMLLASGAMAQTRYIDNLFSQVNISGDVVYGTGLLEAGGSVDLKCDIYTPAGDNNTDRPLLIVAHGGSFIADYGDKSDQYLIDYATQMAKKGYVVAAITYREGWAFSPINTQEQNARAILPAVWRAIQDFKTCVRFFRKSAIAGGNPYGIRQDLIIGGGFGAGAYLPMNAMLLDTPAEIRLPELQQKNAFGQPNGTPYIDTTKADLGGIQSTAGGHAGYDWRVELCLNFDGAVATIKEFDAGINPLVISVHADMDEATPYKTDIVKAAGIFNVIQVSGSYVLTNVLWNKNINKFWATENRDGYPQKQIADETNGPLNMYERGLYTLVGQPYLWSNDADVYTYNYTNPASTPFVDTVSTYSSYRIEKWLRGKVGIDEVTYRNNDGFVKIFPNPATDILNLVATDKSQMVREVEFFDIQGKMVKQTVVINGDAKINISALPKGAYTMKVYFDNTVITDKLIVD